MDRQYLLTGLALIMATVGLAILTFPDNNLHLIACDVGQGDAILAVQGSNQILIDGGPGNQVLDCLGSYMPFWDRKIELVIISHPQKDHFAGIVPVMERYQVESIITSGLDSGTQDFEALKNLVGGSQTRVVYSHTGQVIRLGKIHLEVVYPTQELLSSYQIDNSKNILGAFTSNQDSNHFSIVLNLSLGEFDALLTGDITPEITDDVLLTGGIKDVEYIKAPHHGSKNGLTKELLLAAKPELAVISVGKNQWGHPNKETLDLLKEQGVETLRTDQNGSIEIITNGKEWWIRNN